MPLIFLTDSAGRHVNMASGKRKERAVIASRIQCAGLININHKLYRNNICVETETR